METNLFNKFKNLIYDESGISLSEEKLSLLENRLGKRMKVLAIDSFDNYYSYIQKNNKEIISLLDVVSTNVTHFWREQDHFIFLENLLKQKNNPESVKIWCSASSSGEEPYCLAMILDQFRPNKTPILATDISTRILEKAKKGEYQAKQFETLPKPLKDKYIIEVDNNVFKVSDNLKKLVFFRRLNLSKFPIPLKTSNIDYIFCRNVMIYFDEELRRKLFSEFCRLLIPKGYLFIGHSETVPAGNFPLERVGSSIYRRL